MNKGDFASAEQTYREILRSEPRDAKTALNLGLALKQQDQLEEAVKYLRMATQLQPDFTEASHELGMTLWQQGKSEEAIDKLRCTVSERDRNPKVMFTCGLILKEKGEVEAAIRAFRRAIEIQPNFPEAHYSLALVLRQQGKTETSQEEFKIAESQREGQQSLEAATFATQGGLNRLARGDLEGAVDQFRLATRHMPGYAPAYFQLSLALEKLGRKVEAAGALATAKNLDPGLRLSRSPLGLRGWVQSQLRAR